jgi:uncharacterized protein YjbJ (UPF0337 family)
VAWSLRARKLPTLTRSSYRGWRVACFEEPRKGDTVKQQEARGQAKKVKGRVKEAVGIISGDRKLESEGAAQRAAGAVQESLGKARRKVGEVVTDLGKAIKK